MPRRGSYTSLKDVDILEILLKEGTSGNSPKLSDFLKRLNDESQDYLVDEYQEIWRNLIEELKRADTTNTTKELITERLQQFFKSAKALGGKFYDLSSSLLLMISSHWDYITEHSFCFCAKLVKFLTKLVYQKIAENGWYEEVIV